MPHSSFPIVVVVLVLHLLFIIISFTPLYPVSIAWPRSDPVEEEK